MIKFLEDAFGAAASGSQEFFRGNMLSSLCTERMRSIGPHGMGAAQKMAERPVLVGLIPQVVVIDEGDQVSWISDAGNLRVEFDVNRCPFSSNVFQAPAGMRLLSGPPRPGSKAATYKYRLWLNDQLVGQGEVILREK
jgi:hypothetical protein